MNRAPVSRVIYRTLVLLLTFCAPVLLFAGEAGEPSEGAEGMAGAVGTFEFRPDDWIEGETTYWVDTDGVDPGTAGCHVGVTSEEDDAESNGRIFGEACRADGLLVESNPGAGVRHPHANDTGHPDLFDCNEWCIGEGAAGGECETVADEASARPCAESARCACGDDAY